MDDDSSISSSVGSVNFNVDVDDTPEMKEQRARAELKTRSLRLMIRMSGKRVTIKMNSGSTVTGTLQGADRKMEQIIVSNLETAIGVEKNTVILMKDIETIRFCHSCDKKSQPQQNV